MSLTTIDNIESKILTLRERKVILDRESRCFIWRLNKSIKTSCKKEFR